MIAGHDPSDEVLLATLQAHPAVEERGLGYLQVLVLAFELPVLLVEVSLQLSS